MRAGRRPVKTSVLMAMWLLVELKRDKQREGAARSSVRQASEAVAEHLRETWLGGKSLDAETIRGHYKRFEAIVRKSNTGDEALTAGKMLATARFRRDLYGWDTSTWMLVFDPIGLKALGYDVEIDGRNVKATLKP